VALAAGTRLGPYEILSPLGAGGMGEVYRARDARLGRDVAIKVLPADLASNEERLKRFEKEARSASALSHPNIVTVHDIGTDGVSWIAMELVDGDNLRKLLASGPLPAKRLLGIATQIAEGLAKAHATGIVHRDLKPENLMVTRDGVVKILDFGLAKLTAPTGETGEATQSPTVTAGTEAGVVLGTVGYMSPEQALGQALDFRSDQFSFGAILYEMASGKRAFARPSAPETMTAIIREEPEPLAQAAPASAIPLRWIVERCLAKEREERYGSTRDLAHDLARLRDGAADGSLSGIGAAAAAPAKRISRLGLALGIAGLVVGAAAAAFALRRAHSGPPTYRPVSFHRGAIGNARIAADGQTIFYAAAWEGKEPRIYSTRVDSPESTALPLPSADLLSISSTGKLAILVLHGNDPPAIAEVALAGGAPRELIAADPIEALQFSAQIADYAPGEDRLAVVRNNQLEFPIGKVLVSSANGPVAAVRFLPDGKRLVYVVTKGPNDQQLGIVDLAGTSRMLTTDWEIISSVAWNPVAKEIWFSGRRKSNHIGVVELHAISPSGDDERLVAQNPQLVIVEDIARDGRVLARSDDWPETMVCLAPGATREADLTWLDFSESVALSNDGQDLLFVEGGAGAGATGGTYMRKTDGSSAAVRLGDGWISRAALSPDKKWIAQFADGDVKLVPVGAGESKTIHDEDVGYTRPAWFPDGKRLLVSGRKSGRPQRLWVRDLESGPPRPVTPENVGYGKVSPDGKLVAAADLKTGRWALYAVDGGADPRPIPGVAEGEQVIGFDEKGEGLHVYSGQLKARIERLDLATGRRAFVREVSPADPTGVTRLSSLQMTPDGRAYCYSFMRSLSRLYMVDGLR